MIRNTSFFIVGFCAGAVAAFLYFLGDTYKRIS